MNQIKNLTFIILLCLTFSTLSGTIVYVQACDPASKLVFSAGAAQVLQAGTVSNQITVQLRDVSNDPVDANLNIKINLATTASASGHFYSDQNGKNQVSNINIAQGQSSANFYYQDTTVGNPTLTASSSGLTSGTTQFTIKSADPSPSPSPSPTASPSPDPTPSPSASPSPSPDPTPSPSASPSPSPSASPSPSPSPSTSPDPSPSPATSSTPNPTSSPTNSATYSIQNQQTSSSYKITVISAHGSPTASANVNAGSSFIVQVSTPDGDTSHRWICTGYSIDGGKAIAGSIYTFVDVQAAHTITFNWQEQYYLNVTSDYGVTGGSGWYNSGSTAHFTTTTKDIADNGTQVAFVAWKGTGVGSYTGSGALQAVIMNNPIIETATWATPSTSLYTIGETALIIFALLLLLVLLLAWRRQRKKK